MIACNDVVPLLGPLADGELAGDDRKFVEDHVAGCSACRDRLALDAAVREGLRAELAARAADLPLEDFADRVLARIARDRAPARWARAKVWGAELVSAHRGAFAAGAGMAVAASLALVIGLAPPRVTPGTAAAVEESAVDSIDFGSHDGAVLELPDRTPVIWLADDHGGSGK